MLEGRNVNLRVRDREDVDFEAECYNDIAFWGDNHPPYEQISKSRLLSLFDNPTDLQNVIGWKPFIIQKKDGTRIGIIAHMVNQPSGTMEIVCFLVPNERGKEYGTEAAQLMVDYLFLYRNIVRIEAKANVRNEASQRVLEKVGFKIEGTIRKYQLVRGVWTDYYLLSILREEWKEPRILTRTT